MHKILLDTSRKSIAHKLDIDMNKIYEAMELLLELLKLKYANKFYFSERKINTFIKLNDDESIEELKAYHFHFFEDDMIYIFGVEIKFKDNKYEYTYYNMVDEIPIAFNQTKADNDIYKLKNMINDINSSIEAELRKILNKDDKYIDSINKQIEDLRAVKDFKNIFNERLSKSNIIKKTAKKIQEFYKYKPLEIIASSVKTMYSTVEIEIYAKIEPYVYDRCVHLEFTKDTIFLGVLILSYDSKHKFKPAFKNSKYFTNEITSIKYMRNTFKKYLIAEIVNE
jgi:hypothetical protein